MALGLLASSACVVALLAAATRGFTAVTTDTARALDVARAPVHLAPVALHDRHGALTGLSDPQRSTIVDFVYTRCLTVCSALGGIFQQLQTDIVARRLDDRVRLLSVSFDPTWDTPARLGPYTQLMRANPQVWTVTTPANAARLPVLLQQFGVRVIDDGMNGFVHNAALHIVDPSGQLIAILPIDAGEEAIALAAQHARPGGTTVATRP